MEAVLGLAGIAASMAETSDAVVQVEYYWKVGMKPAVVDSVVAVVVAVDSV